MSVPFSEAEPEFGEYKSIPGLNPESPSPATVTGHRVRYRWTRYLDAVLREGYRGDSDAKQRAIDQICLRTGWQRQACWDRALALDLSTTAGQQSRRQWREEEIARIRSHKPRQSIAELAAQLGRSVRSVREKLKRLNQNRGDEGPKENDHVFYSIAEVAEAIGRNARIVYRWVEQSRLAATPDPITGELSVEERDFWLFITLNYEEVLVHKVSRDYLEWLCAELLPLARPRIVQRGGRKRVAAAQEKAH